MNSLIYTDEEIQNWIERTDKDLIYEAQDMFIDPEEIEFNDLYQAYNRLHKSKYGHILPINLK